jgi:lipooligosaccharide transport system ATP-binding protein
VEGLGARLEVLADRVLVYADDGEAALEAARSRGIHAESSLVRRASLEDVFLQLTGRTLVD